MNKLSIKLLIFLMILFSSSFTAFAKEESVSAELSTTTNTSTLTSTKKSGLVKKDGYLYYYTSKGKKLTNSWKTVDGKRYYFGKTGKAYTGLHKIGDYKYYFYNNGSMLTSGFKTVNGRRFYFGKNGKAYTGGVHKVNGHKYYFNKSGVIQTNTWKKYEGNKYYFCSNGRVATGFKKIGDYKYCFSNSGILQTSKIVGNSERGYYYADSTGVICTDEATKAAATWIMNNTSSYDTKANKLKAAFNYLWKNMTYKRTYGIPGASDLTDYAVEMLTTKQGNCYKYAASFAVFAKVLGYETRVVVGYTRSYTGSWTPHGWTEVKVDGTWYLCDPDMQMNHPDINAYMRTWSNWPYSCQITTKYTLTIESGSLVWTAVS